MLSVLNSDPVDRIPWVPRLDLWYNARKRAGTLPPKYKKASLKEITDDLGFGYHAVVPAFKDLRDPVDDLHRALGIYNLWGMPYRTILENITLRSEYRGDETIVDYHTPHGSLRTKVLYNESMRRDGITITHITEYAVKDPDDYKRIAYIFDNAAVEPNYEGYLEYSEEVGDGGMAVAFVSLAGSPMHLLQRELMPFELFFYELHDHPDEVAQCAASIGRYFERVFEAVADSPTEIVFFGANYDATVTYPPFFHEHILPWLLRFAEVLHGKGIFLLTHADGENRGLLDEYVSSGIDIADSICPKPMTSLSFNKVQEVFRGKITIMGGIPSVCLLPNSFADREFERYIESFLGNLNYTEHLILGVSDTTPPAAPLARLEWIAKRVESLSQSSRH